MEQPAIAKKKTALDRPFTRRKGGEHGRHYYPSFTRSWLALQIDMAAQKAGVEASPAQFFIQQLNRSRPAQ